MQKNQPILKTIFLFLFAVFLLYGCRNEIDVIESTKINNEYKIIHQNYSIVQQNSILNQEISNIEAINSIGKKKSKQQNIINIIEFEGMKIYKDNVTFVSPPDASRESYTFFIEKRFERNNNFLENLILSKAKNKNEYQAYIITYHFPKGYKTAGNDFKIVNFEKIDFSNYTFTKKKQNHSARSTGCTITYEYSITETKHACGSGEHSGDGDRGSCNLGGTQLPYSTYVMKATPVLFDCDGGGGGGGAPIDTGGGAGGNTPPGNNENIPVDTGISLPPACQTGDCDVEILANKINTSLGMPLDHNELLWLNSNTDFAQGIWNMLSNSSSTETKNFAKWGISFAATNNISWPQFQYIMQNKTSYESNLGDDDNNTIGGYDNTVYNTFNPQQQSWTTIQNVLTKAQFIGWGYPGVKRNCMDYAKAQIGIKGYQISNYSATGQTIQVYTSQNGVNKNNVIAGLSYLKYALSKGIPVIVGVEDAPGNPGNADQTTDHFIVIVGMDSDSKGNYFSFFDNASGNANLGASLNNKLYYDSVTGLIKGTSDTPYASGLTYILTQIRKSKLK